MTFFFHVHQVDKVVVVRVYRNDTVCRCSCAVCVCLCDHVCVCVCVCVFVKLLCHTKDDVTKTKMK